MQSSYYQPIVNVQTMQSAQSNSRPAPNQTPAAVKLDVLPGYETAQADQAIETNTVAAANIATTTSKATTAYSPSTQTNDNDAQQQWQWPQNDEANEIVYSDEYEDDVATTTPTTTMTKASQPGVVVPSNAASRGFSISRADFANFLSSPGLKSPKLKSRFSSKPATSAAATNRTTAKQSLMSTTTPITPSINRVTPQTSERILEFRPVQKNSLLTNKSRAQPK